MGEVNRKITQIKLINRTETANGGQNGAVPKKLKIVENELNITIKLFT